MIIVAGTLSHLGSNIRSHPQSSILLFLLTVTLIRLAGIEGLGWALLFLIETSASSDPVTTSRLSWILAQSGGLVPSADVAI